MDIKQYEAEMAVFSIFCSASSQYVTEENSWFIKFILYSETGL